MHPLKWNYCLKINTDSFLTTSFSPFSDWPSGVDTYNQLHFAGEKWESSFINTSSHGFPNACHFSNVLSEYAPDEAIHKTFSLSVTSCCVCFAGDLVMLIPMICYQWTSRWRRGWSWPTSLKWFWMTWEILLPHLSLSEKFMCAVTILAGMYHFAFCKSRFRNCQDQMQHDYYFQSFLVVSVCGLKKGHRKLKHEKLLLNTFDISKRETIKF